MDPAPTILDLKTAFLRKQILTLSQPLSTPSLTAIASKDPSSTSSTTPSQKSMDDALVRVNNALAAHIRYIYGPQVQRHVAEQIDQLYWKAAEREVEGGGEEWMERWADYRNERIISQLPEIWSPEAERRAPDKSARYTTLRNKLVDLSESRAAAHERLKQVKAMQQSLEPFADPQTDVQENLVTRNSEMELELERMRMLMLRVERGLKAVEADDMRVEPAADRMMDVDMDIDPEEDERRRARAVLDE